MSQPTPKQPEKNIHGQKSSPWVTKEESESVPEAPETTAEPMPGTEGEAPAEPVDPDPEPKQNPLLGTQDPEWQAWCERNGVDTTDLEWRQKHEKEKKKGKKGKAPAAPATPAKEETEAA